MSFEIKPPTIEFFVLGRGEKAEIKEVLEAKIVRLETKVIGLESKIQQQNAIVIALQNERHGDEVEIKLHGILVTRRSIKKVYDDELACNISL